MRYNSSHLESLSVNVSLRLLKTTPYGPVGLIWREGGDGRPRLLRIVISHPQEPAQERIAAAFPGVLPASCAAIEQLAARIDALLRGQAEHFTLDLVEIELCPPFQRAALRALHRVRRGEVATYGQLAAAIGRPRAARAIGHAMATNPFPLILPCHRVIRAEDRIGEFGGGEGMKRALLAMEGVRVDSAGRVLQ